jgi:CheY-like chemotaxis protein
MNCTEAGMDGFISKPIDIARLAEVIEHWTSADKSRAASAADTL